MFGWFGWKKGLPLWWSYRLNEHLKSDVEEIFEGIADTRKNILISWTTEYWRHLERLYEQIRSTATGDLLKDERNINKWQNFMTTTYTRAVDFTELFVMDEQGVVICSTYSNHIQQRYGKEALFAKGLDYAQARGGRKCLFGPYADPLTLEIGARSSSFHDKMTLMFIHPIIEAGVWKGAICGRVPNDVIGDLIQRESGHVYPDSGDNYIFMAKPSLNTQIKPGTALSRSRFEDRTFTHGENLKDGVTTDWGTVSIKEHTELEIMFTDPATGDLHPGVAGTIKKGSNLFVEFPGYSDYRHIPVIGKGVTFQLPHCPDGWGMMCEGDLEEVYRIRGIGWRQFKLNLLLMIGLAVSAALLIFWMSSQVSSMLLAVIASGFNLLYGVAAVMILQRRSGERVAAQLREIRRFIRINAEGNGDLTQRLQTSQFDNDETRELAKWINNMIDSLEGIMLQVKLAADDVLSSQRTLNESAEFTAGSTERVGDKINNMIQSTRNQLKDIDHAKDAAGQMRDMLRSLEERAAEQIEVAQGEVLRIGEKMRQISVRVEETNGTIREFMNTAEEIKNVLAVIEEISAQTNLLALNASIEAARVGEHGRGFAVVASEIRKLAELTRKSTEEVHAIITNIHSDAQTAIQSMEEGTQVVVEGTELVAAASEILKNAKEEDSRKTQAVDEVVRLMEKIAQISLENRSISTDVEAKVQELVIDIVNVRHTSNHVEAITAFLQQLVNQFRLTEAGRR